MSVDHQQLPSPAATPSDAQNGPPAALPMAVPPDQAAIRNAVEDQLLQLSQDLYELEISAGNVRENREDAVPDYLESIHKAFISLSQIAPQMTDSVPYQVLDNVDRYKNPHVYTRQTITRAAGENQYALGRMIGLESYRRQLHEALYENFPEVPLPERRHQPSYPSAEEVEPENDVGNGHLGPHDEQTINGHQVKAEQGDGSAATLVDGI